MGDCRAFDPIRARGKGAVIGVVERIGFLTVGVSGFTSAEILERASANSGPKPKTSDKGFPDSAAHEFAPAGASMIAGAFANGHSRWHKRIGWRRVSNKAAIGRAKAEWSRDESSGRQ